MVALTFKKLQKNTTSQSPSSANLNKKFSNSKFSKKSPAAPQIAVAKPVPPNTKVNEKYQANSTSTASKPNNNSKNSKFFSFFKPRRYFARSKKRKFYLKYKNTGEGLHVRYAAFNPLTGLVTKQSSLAIENLPSSKTLISSQNPEETRIVAPKPALKKTDKWKFKNRKTKRRGGFITNYNQFPTKRLRSLRSQKRCLHFSFQKVFAVKVTVRRSHSNVFLTVSGRHGRVFKVFSAGLLGFTNTKKDTPYAAESVGKAVARYLLARRDFSIRVVFLSPLDGRLRAVLRGLGSFGNLLKFTSVKSSFVPAHNGCRPKKARRA